MKWIGTGIAIAVAIIITGSASPLWFLLIPALLGDNVEGGTEHGEQDDKQV